MAKKFVKKQVVGWTASTLTETDLAKAREEGFLAATAEVVFPAPRSSLIRGLASG
jgi:hypothetical protein